MFARAYWPDNFFSPEYWAKVGGIPPSPPPPTPPNIPGGAIIYTIGVPISNYPAVIAAYNVSAPVSTRDANPSIFFYIGDDLSRASNFSLQLTKPSGATLSVTANVFRGSGQPFTTQGVFMPGFYVVYVFGPGDIDQPGTWSVVAYWDDAAGNAQASGTGNFVIVP